jgi:hypothetical protein
MSRKIHEKLFEKEKVELIIISKEGIELSKISFKRIDEKEFILDGKMYDIVKETETKESFYFFCIHDEHEDKLNSSYLNKENRKASESKTLILREILKTRLKKCK